MNPFDQHADNYNVATAYSVGSLSLQVSRSVLRGYEQVISVERTINYFTF